MLVLSRKEGEGICIGDYIEISVVSVHGKRVKLAFSAPGDVHIQRAELLAPAMALSLSQNQPQPHAMSRIPR